jgi:beta-fructofuranosidase
MTMPGLLAGNDPQDNSLIAWTKIDEPVLALPPTGLPKLTGFRDPFVFARKTESSPWKMIVGSGFKGQGGTILLYHSQSLTEGELGKRTCSSASLQCIG